MWSILHWGHLFMEELFFLRLDLGYWCTTDLMYCLYSFEIDWFQLKMLNAFIKAELTIALYLQDILHWLSLIKLKFPNIQHNALILLTVSKSQPLSRLCLNFGLYNCLMLMTLCLPDIPLLKSSFHITPVMNVIYI